MSDAVEKGLQDYLARPRRYGNIDGLPEAAFGLTMLGWVFIAYAERLLQPGLALRAVMLPVLMGAWPLALARCTQLLKQRVTYQRTGFIEPRCSSRRSRVLVFLGSFMVAAIGSVGIGLILRRHPPVIGFAILIGLVQLLSYGVLNRHRLTWRWFIIAAMAAAALIVGAQGADLHGLFRLQPPVFGAIWLVSGLVTFAEYLANTRPVQEAE
jgi:hypothetical protein